MVGCAAHDVIPLHFLAFLKKYSICEMFRGEVEKSVITPEFYCYLKLDINFETLKTRKREVILLLDHPNRKWFRCM